MIGRSVFGFLNGSHVTCIGLDLIRGTNLGAQMAYLSSMAVYTLVFKVSTQVGCRDSLINYYLDILLCRFLVITSFRTMPYARTHAHGMSKTSDLRSDVLFTHRRCDARFDLRYHCYVDECSYSLQLLTLRSEVAISGHRLSLTCPI